MMGVAALAGEAVSAHPVPAQSRPTPPQPHVNVAAGDSVATMQRKLNSVGSGGSLVFPGGSTLNWGGGSIIGRNNVTVWADGVVNISNSDNNNGAFNFGSCTNSVIRGISPGSGFVFNAARVEFYGGSNLTVGNCTFNDCPAHDGGGSAVGVTNATGCLIINNDFNRCGGGIIGSYNEDSLTIDGNHFIGNSNGLPYNQAWTSANPTDHSKGNSIIIVRNVMQYISRTGFECTGEGGYSHCKINNNWFKDLTFAAPPGDGAAPISWVSRPCNNLEVAFNFFRRGTANPGQYAEAIELASTEMPAYVHDNLICDYASPFALYGLDASNPNVDSTNRVFNCGGNLHGATVLSSDPGDPPWPTRIAF
jgi:hypothetical protein